MAGGDRAHSEKGLRGPRSELSMIHCFFKGILNDPDRERIVRYLGFFNWTIINLTDHSAAYSERAADTAEQEAPWEWPSLALPWASPSDCRHLLIWKYRLLLLPKVTCLQRGRGSQSEDFTAAFSRWVSEPSAHTAP